MIVSRQDIFTSDGRFVGAILRLENGGSFFVVPSPTRAKRGDCINIGVNGRYMR